MMTKSEAVSELARLDEEYRERRKALRAYIRVLEALQEQPVTPPTTGEVLEGRPTGKAQAPAVDY